MACLRELMPVAFILQWVGELACYGTNLDRWIDPARKVLKKPGDPFYQGGLAFRRPYLMK
jgi:hypothetical protein